MKKRRSIIAIDGPVGAGKTTTARLAAARLGLRYVDTGAMYRAVTLDVLEHGADPADGEAVARIVPDTQVELEFGDDGQRTFLNGRDVSDRIREQDVTNVVSAVSAQKSVRERMTALQRELGRAGGVVMEGRDIGTVVFPDADCKIYLDASLDVRSKRRHDELAAKGNNIDIATLTREIAERDRANTERDLAPLRKAPDARVIDTSGMTLEEQVEAVVRCVDEEVDDAMAHRMRPFYRIIWLTTRAFYRLVFRIEVIGIENIPPSGGVLVAANHASLHDPPAIGCIIPREATYFVKKELMPVPVIGPFIRYAGAIPVDRGGMNAGALKVLAATAQAGKVVLIFPEGTRTRTGRFGEAKRGVGLAAVMANVPIVPCWIEGSYRAKPFRTRIRVHFLPPFHPSEIRAEDRREHYSLVSERIMNDIVKISKTQADRSPRGTVID